MWRRIYTHPEVHGIGLLIQGGVEMTDKAVRDHLANPYWTLLIDTPTLKVAQHKGGQIIFVWKEKK